MSIPILKDLKLESNPTYGEVELKSIHSHFEDVKLEPNPAYGEVTLSLDETEPQPYEEFVVSVANQL